MRVVVKAQPRYELLHSTYSNRVGSIAAHGLRVSERTKPGTAYCERNKLDCDRADAHDESENELEQVRLERRPDVPTREHAVFFQPADGSVWLDDPRAFVKGEDEMGRPEYDFGFGKDVLYVVDYDRVPCKCGVGDNAVSDEVFRAYLDRITSGDKDIDPEAEARKFWARASVYDPETYDPNEFKIDEKGQETEEPYHELTEVWCPCAIPPSAILARYDKNNPVPGTP